LIRDRATTCIKRFQSIENSENLKKHLKVKLEQNTAMYYVKVLKQCQSEFPNATLKLLPIVNAIHNLTSPTT
jgi:hypothetical protein